MSKDTDDGSDVEPELGPHIDTSERLNRYIQDIIENPLEQIIGAITRDSGISDSRLDECKNLILKFLAPDGCIKPQELQNLFNDLLPYMDSEGKIIFFKHLVHSMNANGFDDGRSIIKNALIEHLADGNESGSAVVISALNQDHTILTQGDIKWVGDLLHNESVVEQ